MVACASDHMSLFVSDIQKILHIIQCIMEIRGMQCCNLVRDPAWAIVQGCSQGAILSASDPHNAWATIRNPF